MSYVLVQPSSIGIRNNLKQGDIQEEVLGIVEHVSETIHKIDGVNFSRETIKDRDGNIWVKINYPKEDKT